LKQRTGFTSVLWSSCLAMLAVGANGTAIMAALPTMRTELFLSSAGVQWAVKPIWSSPRPALCSAARRRIGLAHGWHRWSDWRCSASRPASLPPPAHKLSCWPDGPYRASRQRSRCPALWLRSTPARRRSADR
jgi:hypothetical protein